MCINVCIRLCSILKVASVLVSVGLNWTVDWVTTDLELDVVVLIEQMIIVI